MAGANGHRGGEDGGTWSSPFRKPLSSRTESGPTGRLGTILQGRYSTEMIGPKI